MVIFILQNGRVCMFQWCFKSLFLFLVVLEVQQEGKYAIDSPGNPTAPVIPPEEYELGR